jgi:hypothetical protein
MPIHTLRLKYEPLRPGNLDSGSPAGMTDRRDYAPFTMAGKYFLAKVLPVIFSFRRGQTSDSMSASPRIFFLSFFPETNYMTLRGLI